VGVRERARSVWGVGCEVFSRPMNDRSYFGVGGSRVDGHDEMRVGLASCFKRCGCVDELGE
jgi:hypothetical protein